MASVLASPFHYLADRRWIMGDELTIAGIATFPWGATLIGFYDAGELVDFRAFERVQQALHRFSELPAVVRGSRVPTQQR